jgi:beta-lactamase regulating signal transducer with metallopeptidase domain/uncharacterized GH25 family protein
MITQWLVNEPLASIAIRSFVLLVITFTVAMACRKRSAAVVHCIWVLGFCGCLLIPALMQLSPRWIVAILPPPATSVVPPVPVSPVTTFAQPQAAEPQPIPATPAPQEIADAPVVRPSAPDSIIVVPDAPANRDTSLTLATWLILVWCFGAVAAGSRMVLQYLATRRTMRQSFRLHSESWISLRDVLARQMDLRRPVTLKLHHGAASPMVAGVLCPVVLLPREAQTWSNSRCKFVLLHELAHIKRLDVLTQLLAELACVLYWFNPLAWWGAGEMRRLREIACDDAVIAGGSTPADYAQVLLDVAKDYRSRQLHGAVAMARSTHVEGRIAAILDSARRRAALSRRFALAAGTVGVLLATVVGGVQLNSRAAVIDEPQTGRDDFTQKPDEWRTMSIRVRDNHARPLASVSVLVGVWGLDAVKRIPTQTYSTNDQGEVEITIPRRFRILRVFSSKPGFVPQWANFAEGAHEEGRLIPDKYEFQLHQGSRLGGVVVDTSGKPIPKAKVQVQVQVEEPHWGPAPKPIIANSLASGDDAADTDEDGRWEITNAPPPPKKGKDLDFQLLVTHPNFAGDTRWGELQERQTVTTEQLRAGTARLTMDPGIAITGSITGPRGEPVTKGLVIWNDRPYWATGVNETTIDEQGHYQTLKLAPGRYPVTVVAPGYAPEQRTIQVNRALNNIDFQLKAGNSLRMEIVDQTGKPIPQAIVSIGDWRGTEALYNVQHPNVPESGIPRQASQDGIYIWDWAPDDGVQYRISAPGYDLKAVMLVAQDATHRIELAPLVTVFGKVVDANSGAPIERFRVVPVTELSPNSFSTDFQPVNVAQGKDGVYRIEINSHGRTGYRYRVRIEAEDFRTALGQKSIIVGDPPLKEDFALESAPALVGKVRNPDGKPAIGFRVAVTTPTMSRGFDIDHPNENFATAFRVDDSDEFKLAATFEPCRIRVFNHSGFAELQREPNEQLGTIMLQPWASVSGTLMKDGKAVANQLIYFSPLGKPASTKARFQDVFRTKTDANGRFRFDRLPPMSGTAIVHFVAEGESSPTASMSVPLELKAGDRKELALGRKGATMKGHLVAIGRSDDQHSKNWSWSYLISRTRLVSYPRDAQPLGFDGAGPLQARWLREPDFRNWLATRENHIIKIGEDGHLRIDGVQPGSYDLVTLFYEQPAGCLAQIIGEKIIPITITEDQAVAGEVDLGSIEVKCRIGPRIGSDLRAFKFTDSQGQDRAVDDMNGRYVLFHVWASWSQACLESMHALKAAVAQYADKPLTTVGLNIDKDTAAAKSLAQEERWNWAQNYLSDDSDTMRRLGLSTAPAYYLIDPDGKLLGSANDWQQIGQLLNNNLR